MVELHWPDLGGKQVRYLDDTWELTGDVDVRESGELVAVDAKQVDDVRHRSATLYFRLQNPPASLNPGNTGVHFNRLEREDDVQHLVVRNDRRTYRYELRRMKHD
ncbi:hypothetical protein [Halorarum salinum]|uniref:Uncharacterized protein n=1 Tax=Halorarum salinum TaxID=2743089 RepID=A0A7D5QBU0_9EURY|nr:hypothetical protein [Halobaculum salinum]QLG61141.1 hypothetical protein HUG12_05100 [Halobaculum salinum]